MSDTRVINAGFPPIKYCINKKQSKERSFASKTVDIKNILTQTLPKNDKLIDINENIQDTLIETLDEL
jgi:hypothetical protein